MAYHNVNCGLIPRECISQQQMITNFLIFKIFNVKNSLYIILQRRNVEASAHVTSTSIIGPTGS